MSSGIEHQAEAPFLNRRVLAFVGDITKQRVGAIVNAANSTLLGGGGVDGAIHYAGGPKILEECKAIRKTNYPQGLPTGEAVITTGGDLPSEFVIHTVGPIYGRDQELQADQLSACYKNSLLLAAQNNVRTIAFPSISTGAFGYPQAEAASISSAAIRDFLAWDLEFEQVQLVFFQPRDLRVFLQYQIFG